MSPIRPSVTVIGRWQEPEHYALPDFRLRGHVVEIWDVLSLPVVKRRTVSQQEARCFRPSEYATVERVVTRFLLAGRDGRSSGSYDGSLPRP
jgi:hypothetical protein